MNVKFGREIGLKVRCILSNFTLISVGRKTEKIRPRVITIFASRAAPCVVLQVMSNKNSNQISYMTAYITTLQLTKITISATS